MNEPLDRSAISPCSMKGNEGNHNMNAQTCSRPGPEKVHGVGTSVCQALTSQGGASSELAPLPARSLTIVANGHARSDTSAREPEIGEATALCLRCDAMQCVSASSALQTLGKRPMEIRTHMTRPHIRVASLTVASLQCPEFCASGLTCSHHCVPMWPWKMWNGRPSRFRRRSRSCSGVFTD